MSSNKNSRQGRRVSGIMASLAITAVLCGTYAILVKNGKCQQESADIIISAAIALSAAIGGAVANYGRAQKRFQNGFITGAIYAAILIAVPLAAYPTEVNWARILEIIIISVVCAALGGMVNLCKSNKKFRKSSRTKN